MSKCDHCDIKAISGAALESTADMMKEMTQPLGVVPSPESVIITPFVQPSIDDTWDNVFDKVRPIK